MTDAGRIRAKVNQVRARLFLVLLANFMSVAACGVVLVAVLAGFRNEPAGRPIVLAAVAFALTAGLLAYLRTPSGQGTAERVDRRLGLQQRLETAWECLPSRDELDLLLLRDAAQRLHYVQTSIVAPLRLSRVTKIWLLVGVLLVLSVSIFRILDWSNRWGVFPLESSARAGQGSSPVGEGARMTTRAADAPKPGRGEIRQAGPLDGPPQSAGRSSQRPGTAQDVSLLFPAQEPPSSSAADKGASADRPGDASKRTGASSPAVSPPSSAGGPEKPAAPGGDLSVMQPARRPAVPPLLEAASPGSTAGAASVRKSLQQAVASPTGQSSGRGVGSGAGGTGSPARRAPGRDSRSVGSADAAFIAKHARQYPAIGRVSEAVLADQRIPLGMRQYIAAYFAAIHR
jgi:hypothetical protein